MTTEKKPWLLQTPEEKARLNSPPNGLLEDGLHAAMEKNKDLREMVVRLQQNIQEHLDLIATLNAKLALLNTLHKHGTSQSPTPQPNEYLPDHRT